MKYASVNEKSSALHTVTEFFSKVTLSKPLILEEDFYGTWIYPYIRILINNANKNWFWKQWVCKQSFFLVTDVISSIEGIEWNIFENLSLVCLVSSASVGQLVAAVQSQDPGLIVRGLVNYSLSAKSTFEWL